MTVHLKAIQAAISRINNELNSIDIIKNAPPPKCDARIWLKGGFAAQCSCSKVDGQFLCKNHQKEADSHGGVTKNGSFNGDRPTHHYGVESEKRIPWHEDK